VKVKIETLASSKTILNMNTTTLKLIAVGVAGGLLGFVAARIYFHLPPAPHAQNEKSMEPAEPAEPAEPEKSAEPHESHEPVQPLTLVEPTQPPADSSIVSIEQIDTTNPFNNKKFDPILGEDDHVIGFMYKMEALKKALTRPPPVSIPKKIGHAAFDHKTRDLLL
jgi:hypothetical protein